MTSIFNRIYSYRQRENKNNRENFLTEILGYCLENDPHFRHAFFNNLDIPFIDDPQIITQQSYPNLGIPDLEIYSKNRNSIILIESKIEHSERENQLSDYCKILTKHHKNLNKHLVYITKYFDENHENFKPLDNINFKALKWDVIYSLVNKNHSEITQQLKNYLKEENMDDTKNFNYTDLATLNSIATTISKMDEVLQHIKPAYVNSLGSFPATSKGTKLPDSWYGISHEKKFENFKFWINTGFRWYYGDDIIYIGIRLWIPKEATQLIESLKADLEATEEPFENTESWVYYSEDKAVIIENYRFLSDYITKENDQIPAISQYFSKILEEISECQFIKR
ncbi:PD-(D/E)XK nuclease family protein [Marivirga harenae]|uniref:PD-(D/E)XK nuclease family protein n=1 Tax=Marivirga harenae TaxID=2010992 RepID=UPI0026DF2D31|nr:PD-(D/E)XK nuclease family protein [Marivirga harenae]WKV11262.1 PD-(D/E)XK nuclease family protein [Marivirga harenae]